MRAAALSLFGVGDYGLQIRVKGFVVKERANLRRCVGGGAAHDRGKYQTDTPAGQVFVQFSQRLGSGKVNIIHCGDFDAEIV